MKALYLFLTTEADEPDAVDNFIAGYESNGATWEGTIDVQENIENGDFLDYDVIDSYINSGYDIVIRNTGLAQNSSNPYMQYAKDRGLLFVVPAGLNIHADLNDDYPDYVYTDKFVPVVCGSGLQDVGNATSYPCYFFDDSTERSGNDIEQLTQCGTNYTVTHIQRRSASIIAIKINITGALSQTGFTDHGIPLVFDNMSGSDILPLPDGTKYTSFADGDATTGIFYVKHNTTSGTISTGFTVSDMQSCTGDITFGSTNTDLALMKVSDYIILVNADSTKNGFTIQGVTGFSNNPNGLMSVYSALEDDGFGDKFLIEHSLGSGSYNNDGTLYYITQSYATPNIAGKLLYIKSVRGGTWADTIAAARVTASNENEYDEVDGYGYIRPEKAIDTLLFTTMETPELELQITGETSGILTWNKIDFADYYEIYFRGELLYTIQADTRTKSITVPRSSKARLNLYKIRAVNENETTEFSNEVEFPYYYYSGILVKKYA